MRFYLMIILAVSVLVLIYYITALVHVFTGLFGKTIEESKLFIPFYAWVKVLRNDKDADKLQKPENQPSNSRRDRREKPLHKPNK